MRQSLTYKGYEVHQNILSRQWVANPITAITRDRELTASTAAGLRCLIDDATADQRPNPWELPLSATPQVAAA